MDAKLRVYPTRDGTWLEFKSSNGNSTVLRMETLADDRPGMIGKAIAEWCQERQQEAHADKCPCDLDDKIDPWCAAAGMCARDNKP